MKGICSLIIAVIVLSVLELISVRGFNLTPMFKTGLDLGQTAILLAILNMVSDLLKEKK